MAETKRFAPEVREWAVRMVLEHLGEHESQWATIRSIAAKIGCSAEALRTVASYVLAAPPLAARPA